MRRMKVLTIALAIGLGTLVAAPPANAATGYVYLVTPRWWGWCPGNGNYVKRVDYVNGILSSGGDKGDDIVYAKVDLKRDNTIVMSVQCAKNNPQGSIATIKPNRTGQTFWMGYPSGAYGN